MFLIYNVYVLYSFAAKEPDYYFTQKLPQHYEVKKKKDCMLECFVSDPRARVKWRKGGEPLEVSRDTNTYSKICWNYQCYKRCTQL